MIVTVTVIVAKSVKWLKYFHVTIVPYNYMKIDLTLWHSAFINLLLFVNCWQIWNTECRQIVHEFGNIGVHSVAMTTCDGFFVVGQSACSMADPYHVTQYQITDNNQVDEIQVRK